MRADCSRLRLRASSTVAALSPNKMARSDAARAPTAAHRATLEARTAFPETRTRPCVEPRRENAGKSRDRDDRRGRRLQAMVGEELEPVHLGHHHVQHDHVRACFARQLQPAPAIERTHHIETLEPEGRFEQVLKIVAVVDDQHARHDVPLIVTVRLERTAEPCHARADTRSWCFSGRARAAPTRRVPGRYWNSSFSCER